MPNFMDSGIRALDKDPARMLPKGATDRRGWDWQILVPNVRNVHVGQNNLWTSENRPGAEGMGAHLDPTLSLDKA